MIAFIVAATSNFVWNRVWTFRVDMACPTTSTPASSTVSAVGAGHRPRRAWRCWSSSLACTSRSRPPSRSSSPPPSAFLATSSGASVVRALALAVAALCWPRRWHAPATSARLTTQRAIAIAACDPAVRPADAGEPRRTLGGGLRPASASLDGGARAGRHAHRARLVSRSTTAPARSSRTPSRRPRPAAAEPAHRRSSWRAPAEAARLDRPVPERHPSACSGDDRVWTMQSTSPGTARRWPRRAWTTRRCR